MRVLRFTGLLLLTALATSVTGCDTLAGRLKPEPTVVTIEAKVASTEATLTGEVLAPGRPDSLPLWPGATVIVSTQAQTPQGKSWTASFSTADPFDDVVKGLAVGLKDAGWSAEVADATVGADQTSLLSASGPSAEALFTVVRSADSSATAIDVVVTPK